MTEETARKAIDLSRSGGEGVLADKFTRDPAVGDVVKLLEHNAAEQGQAEFPENR